MTTWAALTTALDARAERGRALRVWWRDDDAGADHPALARLLDLAGRRAWPLALALVPAWLVPAAQARIAASPEAAVIQHGWAHADHAPPGAKAIELGGRDPETILAELDRGHALLGDQFGTMFLAVLAPPWNRIEPALVPSLRGHGFHGLSGFGRRRTHEPAPGLTQVDTHLDPIDWHGSRGFVGEAAALTQLVDLVEADEPIGLLSHHLMLDEAGWRFLERLLALLAAHPGARRCGAAELFGAPPPGSGVEPTCLEAAR